MNLRTHFVYLLFFVSLSFFCAKAQSVELSGNPLGCGNSYSEFERFNLNGQVLLNKNFLPDKETFQKKVIEEAIELQIKHLMGLFKNTKDDGLNVALSAFRGKLNILSTESVKYGNSFSIDNYFPENRGRPKTEYINKALLRGNVKADDSALLVRFQIGILIGDCTPSGSKSLLHKVRLPLDPFLSLWLDDKDKRKLREYGEARIDKISDCSSNEAVLFGNADVNWYFWSPSRKGCHIEAKKIYQPNFKSQGMLTKSEALDQKFFKQEKKFKFASIFGVIAPISYFAANNFPQFKEQIQKIFDQCKTTKNVSECMALWEKFLGPQENEKYFEPGAYHFFAFLKYLQTSVIVHSLKVEKTNENEIFLKIEGVFISSKIPVEVAVYYGRTSLDYGERVSKTYINYLHEALSDYDSIAYVGHAGLGENLSYKAINKLWSEERLKASERIRPLWFGIYNCEGFSYFGYDLEKLFKKGKFDLVMTASSGTDSGAKYPLSQLYYIDMLLANQFTKGKNRIDDFMGQYVIYKDFLTMTKFKSSH